MTSVRVGKQNSQACLTISFPLSTTWIHWRPGSVWLLTNVPHWQRNLPTCFRRSNQFPRVRVWSLSIREHSYHMKTHWQSRLSDIPVSQLPLLILTPSSTPMSGRGFTVSLSGSLIPLWVEWRRSILLWVCISLTTEISTSWALTIAKWWMRRWAGGWKGYFIAAMMPVAIRQKLLDSWISLACRAGGVRLRDWPIFAAFVKTVWMKSLVIAVSRSVSWPPTPSLLVSTLTHGVTFLSPCGLSIWTTLSRRYLRWTRSLLLRRPAWMSLMLIALYQREVVHRHSIAWIEKTWSSSVKLWKIHCVPRTMRPGRQAYLIQASTVVELMTFGVEAYSQRVKIISTPIEWWSYLLMVRLVMVVRPRLMVRQDTGRPRPTARLDTGRPRLMVRLVMVRRRMQGQIILSLWMRR